MNFPFPFIQYLLKHFINFYWNTLYMCCIALQCPVSLYCTARWTSYAYCLVTQSCLTLCDPMVYSPPGSSVHGILQERVLEWVAMPSSRGSSLPGIEPRSPNLQAIFCLPSHQRSPRILEWVAYPFSRESSWPRNPTRVSCIAGRFFTSWATREAPHQLYIHKYPLFFGFPSHLDPHRALSRDPCAT